MFTTVVLSLNLIGVSFVVMLFGGMGWALGVWIVTRLLSRV